MKVKSWIAIILFWFAGVVGWIAVSVIEGAAQGLQGKTSFHGDWLLYTFGLIVFFTLPTAFITHTVKKIKNRKKKIAQ